MIKQRKKQTLAISLSPFVDYLLKIKFNFSSDLMTYSNFSMRNPYEQLKRQIVL